MVLATSRNQTPIVTWEKLPDDFILPDEPVENLQQPTIAAALTDALGAANRIQPQMLIAVNFALVATVNQKNVVKAPDWLYVPNVLPVGTGVIRRSYTPNIEGSAVAVVMEFLSDADNTEYSIRPTFPYGKLYFYEQILKVPTYVIFNPYELTLEVRCLQNNQYVLQEASELGRYWIPELELFLGIWQGTRLGLNIDWLRWWDEAGNLLLWSSEQVELEKQRAEAAVAELESERQKKELFAAKLRELGVNPDLI
ncbi:Uma2 family endonuclease [Calothrix sp. UHCC 0171]|uniref:Uma2 family endonuclease n=1 Tax=Calothrix sp. UHCC 0171 TaxID=3110245 RepID=UPI002B2054BC|nr:Uma2 family endonuclease [Calothrix sp. UHCC 0171]MEA5570867.1 Uma2 family endonuclease [Calothrix sp. UHCC 0171]